MRTRLATARGRDESHLVSRLAKIFAAGTALLFMLTSAGAAMADESTGGEANLKLPDLSQVRFLNFGGRPGIDGHALLVYGILFCIFGLAFGMTIYVRLKNLPVHRCMREISELIYETCKTYLVNQGKFLFLLWIFIAAVIVLYFGVLRHYDAVKVAMILFFSVVGILGSYGVAWFGIRVNTFANSRTAFAGLRGKPYPIYQIPLRAGMSIGMMLISVELMMMLIILLFVPGDYAGPCFIGFAIGESLGAAALRIAGGIFTKIADIGADLMKIVFKIKEDDARNPGVIADCTGDNAGDSVGPSADGFETYGVTGVALITFILLGVSNPVVQVQLLVWIFVMRIAMLVASAAAYFINTAIAKARFGNADKMNFESPLTSLVWITSLVSIGMTFLISYFMIPDLERRHNAVVEARDNHLLRDAGRRDYSGTREGIHLDRIAARPRSGRLGARGRRVAGNSVRLRGGQFLRLLSRLDDGHPDVDRLHGQPRRPERHDDCRSGICFRAGGVRLSGHGPRDDRRRFLRPGNGQRAVGLRTVADRASAQHQAGTQDGLQHRRKFPTRQGHAGRKRRRRKYVQGHREARADRHGSRRRDHHDFLDHHGADQRADDERRQALAACMRRLYLA